METIGIGMGASSITAARMKGDRIEGLYRVTHEGNVRKSLEKIMNENDLNSADRYAVTGRKFKSMVNLPSLAEAEAVELAYNHIAEKYDDVDAIVSAGAETFLAYELNDKGKIINVFTGNKCASGTGEFFLQQIKRMDLSLDKAMELAQTDNPYLLSGRCSVFCKSDCTHALNKGEDKGIIVAGLCRMMAEKILELLSNCDARKIMLVGGTSRNNIMVEFLEKQLSQVVIPEEACYFEALGTSIWARKQGTGLEDEQLLAKEQDSFDSLPPLEDYQDQVKFYDMEKTEARDGDRCILGLDVGSTTTKAVLIKEEDDSLVDSVYLRTSGDPVDASRRCYEQLASNLDDVDIEIIGLGVTGSGRRIAGLHALTDSVINEIISHAEAAVYFDQDVDTIFEIGGQDAKYTYIVNKVPTDYAMNEACSAGTGSFLEESAEETLNIQMEDIADIALKGDNPPNFSDQCAAFISSDIKNAIQEGYAVEDICAGLVYSICMNYRNRVKGNRPVGDKVFMQGGVCYNKAVPMAMAALTDKEIVVPPEPGLMGAFGVALVVKEHLKLGLVEENSFDLEELAGREVKRENSFVCAGGSEGCDRKCEINVLNIKGEKYPFGGICNKYVNQSQNVSYDIEELDLVRYRQNLMFDKYYAQPDKEEVKGRVGLNRSLMVNQLLPLYSKFFAELGYEVILPDEVSEKGVQKLSSAFCYPVELSHGYMEDLLQKETDYIFLPHVKGLHVENSPETSVLCPMAQSEPYYLKATWEQLNSENVFSPVLDFQNGYQQVQEAFVSMAQKMGSSRKQANDAFAAALSAQENFTEELKDKGREVLAELKENPEEKVIVAFGRPYNAFAQEANMGIPHKFASRGEKIIPLDMLPVEKQEMHKKMYWSMGQLILKAADFVSEHPQLFGLFVTNFSCGPDSFLVNFFRRKNGRKPSLTLELDSHTADAGLNTRIEAFLDVVDSYRQLIEQGYDMSEASDFMAARVEDEEGEMEIIDSAGNSYDLTDDNVQILIPSMSDILTKALASALEYGGVNAETCPPPGERELDLGRSNATG
ncbi:MAG: acyl-CoA dehydratase activase, partial [Bacillota bacterium]